MDQNKEPVIAEEVVPLIEDSSNSWINSENALENRFTYLVRFGASPIIKLVEVGIPLSIREVARLTSVA